MKTCTCREPHERRRIVLTGGPGAGKTAVLELVRQYFCTHVKVLPEAAGILFSGGFPRVPNLAHRQAEQRAIFFVQRELERGTEAEDAAIVLCDRGTIDGSAYWTGPGEFWSAVGTTLDEQLRRYDAVIHLRVPTSNGGYNHSNPLRLESASEAAAIDERIAAAWQEHPHRHVIEATSDFISKAAQALEVLRLEMPECCRHQVDFYARTPRIGS